MGASYFPEALVERLDQTCPKYKMEIIAMKTKLMTNSANGIQREIKVQGQKLGTVSSTSELFQIMALNQKHCRSYKAEV